jgi:hypothetical protein
MSQMQFITQLVSRCLYVYVLFCDEKASNSFDLWWSPSVYQPKQFYEKRNNSLILDVFHVYNLLVSFSHVSFARRNCNFKVIRWPDALKTPVPVSPTHICNECWIFFWISGGQCSSNHWLSNGNEELSISAEKIRGEKHFLNL